METVGFMILREEYVKNVLKCAHLHRKKQRLVFSITPAQADSQ